MPLEGIYLFGLLTGSMALLVATGVGALVAGRRSVRASVMIGVGGALVSCLTGLAMALAALVLKFNGTAARPWNIPYGEFRLGLDPLSAFFLIPLFLLSGLAAIYAVGYLAPWKNRNPGRFWFFYNLLVASMALVLTARNGVLFLVAWETMTLTSFFLVIFDDEETGVGRAGWIYLVATHIGTALLIALFMLLGRESGSQNFALYAVSTGSAGTLFLLALLGFGTKAGLYPLHVWLPEAHPAAPSPVSAVMSGVMIKTGLYGILRTLTIVGTLPAWCGWLVLGIGAVSGVLGVLYALVQHDIKRLLAYSSVENIGIIALGIGLGMLGLHYGSPTIAALGFVGALLHVLNHALFKGLLFMGAGAVVHATGTRDIEQLGGLLKRMPWTGAAFLAGAAAISALPPFNGFASEFLIYVGSFKSILGTGHLALGGTVAVVALALMGGLAAVCFARAFGMVFLGQPRSPAPTTSHEVGAAMRWPMAMLAALCLGIGIFAGVLIPFMEPTLAMLSVPEGTLVQVGAARALLPVAVTALVLLLIVGILVVIRLGLLRKWVTRETGTWGCGYAAPAASMQYTGMGFAQPLTRGAHALLRPHEIQAPPRGIYPAAASFRSTTKDGAEERLFEPLFRRITDSLGRLRWLQQGRVHWYILYVVVTLVVLLGWAFRS